MVIYKAIEKILGKTVFVRQEVSEKIEAILCDEPFVRNPDMPNENRSQSEQLTLKLKYKK